VSPGQTLDIGVQIATPAAAGGASVVLGGDYGDLGSIVVAEGTNTGNVGFPIPVDVGVVLPFTGTITATSGGATMSVSVTMEERAEWRGLLTGRS
jgi:hypothetical protein